MFIQHEMPFLLPSAAGNCYRHSSFPCITAGPAVAQQHEEQAAQAPAAVSHGLSWNTSDLDVEPRVQDINSMLLTISVTS